MILTKTGIVDKFSKTSQYQILWKSTHWSWVVPCVQIDGQLDRTISVADLQLLPGMQFCLKIGICICNNTYW